MNNHTNIHLIDSNGDIKKTISLAELIATGDNYTIHLLNDGPIGSKNCELIVYDEPQILIKVEMGNKLSNVAQ